MALQFRQATKQSAFLRLALIGVAGSGKTYTALQIARYLAQREGSRIAVIDTERGSASKYCDLFDFDVIEPELFRPQDYIEMIQAAQSAGFGVLVVDSLSHAWQGRGGALEQVDNAAKRSQSGNTFGAWRDVTPQHNMMVDTIISARLHVIATMRAKTEYVTEKDDRTGKTTVRKIGMAPVQRDGLEYEFDVVADMDMDNNMLIGKTRCPDIAERIYRHKSVDELAGTLTNWLRGAAPVVDRSAQNSEPSPDIATAQAQYSRDLERARCAYKDWQGYAEKEDIKSPSGIPYPPLKNSWDMDALKHNGRLVRDRVTQVRQERARVAELEQQAAQRVPDEEEVDEDEVDTSLDAFADPPTPEHMIPGGQNLQRLQSEAHEAHTQAEAPPRPDVLTEVQEGAILAIANKAWGDDARNKLPDILINSYNGKAVGQLTKREASDLIDRLRNELPAQPATAGHGDRNPWENAKTLQSHETPAPPVDPQAEDPNAPGSITERQRTAIHALGNELWPDSWKEIDRHRFFEGSTNDLSKVQAIGIIDRLEHEQQQRANKLRNAAQADKSPGLDEDDGRDPFADEITSAHMPAQPAGAQPAGAQPATGAMQSFPPSEHATITLRQLIEAGFELEPENFTQAALVGSVKHFMHETDTQPEGVPDIESVTSLEHLPAPKHGLFLRGIQNGAWKLEGVTRIKQPKKK
jgi:hypothetical protein